MERSEVLSALPDRQDGEDLDGVGFLHDCLPSAPERVSVRWPGLSPAAAQALDAAWEYVTVEKALDTDVALTDIWSYTGNEGTLADYLVTRAASLGLSAEYQPLDGSSANALLRLSGRDDGPVLALVAPSDTHFTGNPEEDGLQWGEPMRRDNRLPATVEGQTVIGLSSDNPKGLCAAILLAMEALHASGLSPAGDVVGAFVAAGAPARSNPAGEREVLTLGAGARHALAMGVTPDWVVYHKPGYQVAWEDSALNQFEITVAGVPGYMANGGSYEVVEAACTVALEFNHWAEAYRQRTVGHFNGQAALNVIQVGRPDKPNWSSGVAKLFADIRTAPGGAPALGRHIMTAMIDSLREKLPSGVTVTWRQRAYMPGGQTDPESWIVQSAIRGALAVDGRKEDTFLSANTGQTEMGFFQRMGIESVKVQGLPGGTVHPEKPDDLPGFTLSAAYAPFIAKAAKVMIYTVIDTLSRSEDARASL